jgi:hypothetical protein
MVEITQLCHGDANAAFSVSGNLQPEISAEPDIEQTASLRGNSRRTP